MPINRQVIKEQVVTYATVLFDGANEAGGQDRVLKIRSQMEDVMRIARSNIDLVEALRERSYTPEQREGLARAVFAACDPYLLDVLVVMAERDEFDLLTRVWQEYCEILEEKLDIVVCDVATVVELDDRLRQIIIDKVQADFGTAVVLDEHIDPSLLGGILINARGKRIDASLLSQLELTRTKLKNATDGGERQ